MTYEEAKERIDCILKNNPFTKADIKALALAIESIEKQIEISKSKFTHICKSDRDPYPTAFSIYARVIERDENTVTLERFMKFGALPMEKITISKKEFDRYYKEIKEELAEDYGIANLREEGKKVTNADRIRQMSNE